MQEGEANPWLKGFCRLHYAMCSLVPFLSPAELRSMRVAAGDSWRGQCWQLRFTELALALKAEGWAAIYLRQGKLSSLTSHTAYPRIAWGSGVGVQ